jgi:hypothetical protein
MAIINQSPAGQTSLELQNVSAELGTDASTAGIAPIADRRPSVFVLPSWRRDSKLLR